MSPLDLMQRLAALVPWPRLHLIRLVSAHFASRSERTPASQTTAFLHLHLQIRPMCARWWCRWWCRRRCRKGPRQQPRKQSRRVRGELYAPPPGAAASGQAAQASLRSRRGTLPELRRRAEDHCGHPGAAGDREDPHAPGVAGQGATTLNCSRTSAASGMTIPIHHCSGGPARRAAGVGCVRVVAGPMARTRPSFPSVTTSASRPATSTQRAGLAPRATAHPPAQ